MLNLLQQRRRKSQRWSNNRQHASLTIIAIALCCILSTLSYVVTAERDGNSPWSTEDDSNVPKKFQMYWSDPNNVLEDLTKFQSLYIKHHRCVWSEYGTMYNFDDDGENHDGDENWYGTRAVTFRANAAYSLYGVLKGEMRAFKCTSATYINTFFTTSGSDNILSALGYDDDNILDYNDNGNGNSYCSAIGNDGDEHRRFLRILEGGDEDKDDEGGDDEEEGQDNNEEDAIQALSTTMGCSDSGNFAMATFSDEYCDGNYFIQTVDNMKKYNSAMNSVSCEKIWDYSSDYQSANRRQERREQQETMKTEEDDEALLTVVAPDSNNNNNERQLEDNQNQQQNNYAYNQYFGSAAELILMESVSCDISLYKDVCPDPYGLKRRYNTAVNGGLKIHFMNILKWPMRIISWMFFIAGSTLLCISYYVKKRSKLRRMTFGEATTDILKDFSCGTEFVSLPGSSPESSPKRRSRTDKSKKKKKKKKSSSSGDKTKSSSSKDKKSKSSNGEKSGDKTSSSSRHKSSSKSSKGKVVGDYEGDGGGGGGIGGTFFDAAVSYLPGRSVYNRNSGPKKNFFKKKEKKNVDEQHPDEIHDHYVDIENPPPISPTKIADAATDFMYLDDANNKVIPSSKIKSKKKSSSRKSSSNHHRQLDESNVNQYIAYDSDEEKNDDNADNNMNYLSASPHVRDVSTSDRNPVASPSDLDKPKKKKKKKTSGESSSSRRHHHGNDFFNDEDLIEDPLFRKKKKSSSNTGGRAKESNANAAAVASGAAEASSSRQSRIDGSAGYYNNPSSTKRSSSRRRSRSSSLNRDTSEGNVGDNPPPRQQQLLDTSYDANDFSDVDIHDSNNNNIVFK